MIVGSGLKTRLVNFEDELWDRRLGVRTFGFHPGSGEQGKPNWFLHYAPTPYARVKKLYEMIGLNEDDVVVDLGAGLGRSVFLAKSMGAKKAIGVDIAQPLCDKANISAARSGVENVEFICCNATEFKFSNVSVLFMAHSFGDDTLRAVMKNLEASSKGLRIIYVNPICDYVFKESGWLECFGRLEERKKHKLLPRTPYYAATIWRTIAI